MAFNVGLYLVMAYTMLEAGDALVVGDLTKAVAAELGHADLDPRPFVVLSIAILAWLNYRGVFMTLTVNFVITAAALLAILILFVGVSPWEPAKVLLHKDLLVDLPYGWIGVIASLQFGMWYYLGIEGTCQAAEEVRSAGRSIPLGTLSGMITLLIAASLTWYVAAGLMPWEYLGQAITPLYDAAKLTGSGTLQVILFVGTIFSAIASANEDNCSVTISTGKPPIKSPYAMRRFSRCRKARMARMTSRISVAALTSASISSASREARTG